VNGAKERLRPENRLRSTLDYAAVRRTGRAFRGQCCLILALACAGEPTRFGFIASKKSVGDAVDRNRARRRLREIVRRRWPRVQPTGHWIVVIAQRGSLTAEHQELATELEHLLASAGALAPIASALPH
jgi:ribonuclease P protein component